jgi:hypothetical protein
VQSSLVLWNVLPTIDPSSGMLSCLSLIVTFQAAIEATRASLRHLGEGGALPLVVFSFFCAFFFRPLGVFVAASTRCANVSNGDTPPGEERHEGGTRNYFAVRTSANIFVATAAYPLTLTVPGTTWTSCLLTRHSAPRGYPGEAVMGSRVSAGKVLLKIT